MPFRFRDLFLPCSCSGVLSPESCRFSLRSEEVPALFETCTSCNVLAGADQGWRESDWPRFLRLNESAWQRITELRRAQSSQVHLPLPPPFPLSHPHKLRSYILRHVHWFLPFSDRGFNATSRLDWGAVLTIKSRLCNRAGRKTELLRSTWGMICGSAGKTPSRSQQTTDMGHQTLFEPYALPEKRTVFRRMLPYSRYSHAQAKWKPTERRRHPAHPVPAPCHRRSCHRGRLHIDGRERRRGQLAVRPHAAVVRRAVQIGHDRAVLLVVARGVVVGIDRRVGEGA